jgi:aminomethyltransferase
MSKKTYLYEEHLRLQGKMVDFSNWLLPIQYTSIKDEHLAVRSGVGLFDVSHMGEIRVQGSKAQEFLELITTNLVSKLEQNQAQYTLLLNHHGGVIDDLYLYCLAPKDDYLLCVNAANDDKDWAWILAQKQEFKKNHALKDEQLKVTHESSVWSQIAVQGPQALKVLGQVLSPEIPLLKKNRLIQGSWNQYPFIYANSGYTGEQGGEIFIKNEAVTALWRALLDSPLEVSLDSSLSLSLESPQGKVTPCGLGARDTLRTEMGYCLYGHELNETSNPLEAGLGWVIKTQEKDFLGKSHLLTPKQTLVGFVMKDRAIPRSGYELHSCEGMEEKIGWVTSGTYSPCLEKGIGLGYLLESQNRSPGQRLFVDIRGRKQEAEITALPLIKKIK